MKKIQNKTTRENILKTAAKLFAKKGFDAVSIREICREANINICMISYYFGGKKELYNAIINDLIDIQTEYAKTFIDFKKNPDLLSINEKKETLYNILDKLVDFFYQKVSGDIIFILLREQYRKDFNFKSPTFEYIRQLVASILKTNINDRTAVFKTAFLLAQINSPRVLPALSLRLLGQDEVTSEDIKIIKENVKMYINLMLGESGGV